MNVDSLSTSNMMGGSYFMQPSFQNQISGENCDDPQTDPMMMMANWSDAPPPFILQHALNTEISLSGNVLMQPPLRCCPSDQADQLEGVANAFKMLSEMSMQKAVEARAKPPQPCSELTKMGSGISPSSDQTTPTVGGSSPVRAGFMNGASSPLTHSPGSPLAHSPGSPLGGKTPEQVQCMPPGPMQWMFYPPHPDMFSMPPYPAGFPMGPPDMMPPLNQAYAPAVVTPQMSGSRDEGDMSPPSEPSFLAKQDSSSAAFNLNAHASTFQPTAMAPGPFHYPVMPYPQWKAQEPGWVDFAETTGSGLPSQLAHISTSEIQELLAKYQRKELTALETKIALHDLGSCKPCAFFHFPKKLCNNIRECHFCHHEEHRKYSMKCWKRRRQRITKDIGVQALEMVNQLTNDTSLIQPETPEFYREADYIMACRSLKLSVEGNFPVSIKPLHQYHLKPEVIEMVENGKMAVDLITKDDLLDKSIEEKVDV